jgi:hypothetical protein
LGGAIAGYAFDQLEKFFGVDRLGNVGVHSHVHRKYTDSPNSELCAFWALRIFNKLFVFNAGTYSDSPASIKQTQ